jgi:hypothetical protein
MRTLGAHTERASELFTLQLFTLELSTLRGHRSSCLCAPMLSNFSSSSHVHGAGRARTRHVVYNRASRLPRRSNGGRAARKTQGQSEVIRGNQCAFSAFWDVLWRLGTCEFEMSWGCHVTAISR